MKTFPKLDFSRMTPYKEQQEILDDDHRFKVMVVGRQSGKSWLARRICLDKAANEGMLVWWVAPTMSTARGHWQLLLKLIEQIEFPTKRINKTEYQIDFWSGGTLRIRSADDPDNLRGETLDFVVLDEARFMREEVWYRIIQPALTASRGSAIIATTPKGMGWIYDLYLRGQVDDPYYKSWNFNAYVSPYQDRGFLKYLEKETHPQVWREEYLAEFIPDGGGVFANVGDAATSPFLSHPLDQHDYVAGVDWGLDEDFTVFTVVDKHTRQQVYGTRFTGVGTEGQISKVISLLDLWNPVVTYIEKNGIGEPLLKLLIERLMGHETAWTESLDNFEEDMSIRARHRIRAVHMNNDIKRRIVERIATDIEYGRLFIIDRENEFGAIQVREMSTFMRKLTMSGMNITYKASPGNKDDTISALALAYMGVPKPRFKKPWLSKTELKNPFRVQRGRLRNARSSRIRAPDQPGKGRVQRVRNSRKRKTTTRLPKSS